MRITNGWEYYQPHNFQYAILKKDLNIILQDNCFFARDIILLINHIVDRKLIHHQKIGKLNVTITTKKTD